MPTFKRRVITAFALMFVVMLIGSGILLATDAPESLHQVLIGVVGVPLSLYLAWAIVRERDELERENGG